MQSSPLPLCLAVLCLLAYQRGSHATPGGKLDAVNVDEVLANKEMVDAYAKCLLEQMPCSEEGAELKERLPQRLSSRCEGCSDMDKESTKKVVMFMKTSLKDTWDAFKAKYDPDNKWNEDEWIK